MFKKCFPENECWNSDFVFSDFTGEFSFISFCWNPFNDSNKTCCSSQSFQKSNHFSILFLIGATCAIFGVDDNFFKENEL
jgi:hypothetical protein